jgi:quinol monooxygenase YgiN
MADVPTPDPDVTRNMCEWITITALDNIHDHITEKGQLRLDILRALVAREDCEGYRRCDWGRVVEDQSHIYVWTSWTHEAAYRTYVGSDTHRSLYEQLNKLSSTSVTVQLIQYNQGRCYTRQCLDGAGQA